MPIYEFKCLDCNETFEKLFLKSDEEIDLSCPECTSKSFVRVVSGSNYAMGAGPGGNKSTMSTKSCGPSNKCMSFDIPDPTR